MACHCDENFYDIADQIQLNWAGIGIECLSKMTGIGQGCGKLFSVYFKIGFLNFSSICCWYTFELPHRGDSNVHLQHMSIQ